MARTRQEALGQAVIGLAEAIGQCVVAQRAEGAAAAAATEEARCAVALAMSWLAEAAAAPPPPKRKRRQPLAFRNGPRDFPCGECGAAAGASCVFQTIEGVECTPHASEVEFHAARKRSAGRRK